MQTHEKITALISSLSFNEYVLIDCLKFGRFSLDFQIDSHLSNYLCNFDFIALTEQGFINIFDEITDIKNNLKVQKTISKFTIRLLSDGMKICHNNFTFIIRYVPGKQRLIELMNLPAFDFYKCYYDGVKMHCTPEAVQCHKIGIVNYTGTLNIDITYIKNIFSYKRFKFQNIIWKVNSDNTKSISGSDVKTSKNEYYTLIKSIIQNPIDSLC